MTVLFMSLGAFLGTLLGVFIVWTLLSLVAHLRWRREFHEFDKPTFWLMVLFFVLAVADLVTILCLGGVR